MKPRARLNALESDLRDLITTWQMRDDAGGCAGELEEVLNRHVPPEDNDD